MRFTVLLLSALLGCHGDGAGLCHDYGYADQTRYAVSTSVETPEGIRVDPTGQDVSIRLIDSQTDEVETCLRETFGDPPLIPPDVRLAGECLDATFDLPIERACLTVKVPDDWTLSCDGSQQVLNAQAPDELCAAKGLTPTPDCPCRWRAGIQDRRTIVVTPSLYLYKDPLIRVATGCNNPWGAPELARCAAPSVPPLPVP